MVLIFPDNFRPTRGTDAVRDLIPGGGEFFCLFLRIGAPRANDADAVRFAILPPHAKEAEAAKNKEEEDYGGHAVSRVSAW